MGKSVKIYKTLSVSIIGLAMVIILALNAYASQGDFFEFKADCKIEIVGEPQLGEPFEVVFTFTPRQDIIHTRGIADTAILSAEEGVEFLSGDTIWTGLLKDGLTYSLKARFMVNEPIMFRIRGGIVAVQARGFIAHAEGSLDNGIRATKSASSRLIDFSDIKPNRKSEKKYMPKDSSYEIIIVDLPPSTLNSGFGPEKPIIVKMDSSRDGNTINGLNETLSENVDTNYIYLNIRNIKKTDTLFFHPKKTNVIVTPKLRTRPIIKANNRLLDNINDTTYILHFNDELTPIEIFLDDTTVTLPVKLLSIYSICGDVSYVDNFNDIHISKHVYVGLYNCFDDNCQENEYAGYTYTDLSGDFCFWADSPIVVVAVWSDNPVNTVMYAEDHDLSIGDLLRAYYYSVLIRNYGFQDIYIPDDYLRADNLDLSGAFNILHHLYVGREYLEYDIGHQDIPAKNVSVWDAQDGSRNTSSFAGFSTGNNIPGFYFASRANLPDHNWDEWDRGVILHEYGHYIMYHCMDDIPETGGAWIYLTATQGKNNLNLAMSEGWASFFSSAALDDQIFVNSLLNDPFYIIYYY